MAERGAASPEKAGSPPGSEELREHLALALVPGLGPRLTAALLARFGSAGAVRRASVAELSAVPHIGPKLARQFAAALQAIDVEKEWQQLERYGVGVVLLGRAGYPTPLAAIASPPPLLFVKGEWQERDRYAVAIVGTRQATPYGRRLAHELAAGLAAAGWTVVSGLARGIDGAAHQGALAAGGRTIAVLAGGLARIYPPEHRDLAEAVSRQGCLLTETPLLVPPQAGMFPARNRLISGLSRAVIVVEAGDRSGALITARHAGEQGREVFVIPGAVDRPHSAGCLALLRQGARLVRNVADVLDDLRGLGGDGPPAAGAAAAGAAAATAVVQPGLPLPMVEARPEGGRGRRGKPLEQASSAASTVSASPPLSPELQAVYDALATPRHVDELAAELRLSVAQLAPRLMQLELLQRVRRLPGHYYEQS